MKTESNLTISEPSFRGKHSRALRIWHWGTFIIITGSLTTVLFAKIILNNNHTTAIVLTNLQKNSITITPDQAKSVAHEFNDIIWHWHIYLGYFLAALLGFRILFEFFQPEEQKIIPILKKSWKYLKMPGVDTKKTKHYLLVRCVYILFYFALIVQVCTGLFMVYSDDIDSLKKLNHTAKNIHSVFMLVIIFFIVLHINGVILAELGKKDKGIVSDMINGGE